MNFDTWRCPSCKYIITDIEARSARYDFGCPRCKTSLTKFIFIPKEVYENNQDT